MHKRKHFRKNMISSEVKPLTKVTYNTGEFKIHFLTKYLTKVKLRPQIVEDTPTWGTIVMIVTPCASIKYQSTESTGRSIVYECRLGK